MNSTNDMANNGDYSTSSEALDSNNQSKGFEDHSKRIKLFQTKFGSTTLNNEEQNASTNSQDYDDSEAKDKKNNKQASSCDSCRERKLACNKEKPRCDSCRRKDLTCYYSYKKMSKNNKPSVYITSLQNRVAELEKLLQEKESEKEVKLSMLDNIHLSHPYFKDRNEILLHLINTFFLKMVRFMGIINEEEFYLQYQQGTLDKLLLYSVCALGSIYSDYFNILSTKHHPAGRDFADKAEQWLMERFTRTPTLVSIQAGLLLGAYEFAAGRGEMSVFFLSSTHRAAQYIGLNFIDSTMLSNPINPGLLTHEQLEIRRRMWWECLSSDVIAATLVGRPLIIDDRDYVVNLPMEDNKLMKLNEIDEIYYYQLLYTLINYWREIFRFTHHRHLRKWLTNDVICKHIKTYQLKLNHFKLTLPPNLTFYEDKKLVEAPTKLQCCAAILCVVSNLLTILLHRSHLAHAIENKNIAESELESKQICIESATNIVKVVEVFQGYEQELGDVYTSFAVFNAATIINNVLYTNKKEYVNGLQIHQHYKLLKQFLKDHAKVWSMNNMFLEILKLMEQTFKRGQLKPDIEGHLAWLSPTSTSYVQWYFSNVAFNS
ncbi:hypothetical protein K502DRAFT_300119 [Neoconidiobolus thromboides FSU 785]|nr:hypothetical protein K502DRAFT_300119 [Neoconidiobolus thromboides FSU 785]